MGDFTLSRQMTPQAVAQSLVGRKQVCFGLDCVTERAAIRRVINQFILEFFLYAQGNDAQVQIAFASHLITVTGHGLGSLLIALATQQALRLIQPAESDVTICSLGPDAAATSRLSICKIAIEPF
jgi:hypothetical protein